MGDQVLSGNIDGQVVVQSTSGSGTLMSDTAMESAIQNPFAANLIGHRTPGVRKLASRPVATGVPCSCERPVVERFSKSRACLACGGTV